MSEKSGQNDRRPFESWQIALVYKAQDGICIKCGNPLEHGFHRHHKNGDHTDNSVANLELHCPVCHGGEAYTTLIDQKKKALGEVEAMIQMSMDGKLSGAAADKLLDAIKLQLSLSRQINGLGIEDPPAEIRAEGYLVSSGILLKKYEEGFMDCMRSIRINQVGEVKKNDSKKPQ